MSAVQNNMPASLDVQAHAFLERGPAAMAAARRAIEILAKQQGVPAKVKKTKHAKVKKSAIEVATKAALRPGRERIAGLQKLLKSRPTDVGLQYLLAKAQLSAANESARIFATVGTAANLQPTAIAVASAPSISNALGASIGRTPHDPRSSLRGVWNGDYRRLAPSDLPGGDPTSAALRENHEIVALEKELAEAQRSKGTAESMQRVAQLSYMLTRARLVEGHRDGSLGGRPV